MFKELKPLLSKRGLVLTVNATGEDRIRVTITPRSVSKDESKEETSECPTAESHRRGKGVNHTWKRFNRKLGT